MGDERIAHGAPIDRGRQIQIAARLDAALAKLPEERVTFMV